MLRLSIVIPAMRRVELLENSLVSVLQNRPADCEILIVHSDPYDDPHHLAGEVRFIPVASGATLVQTVNAGFRHARAPVVHLLGCGAEVTAGWTDAPLRQFAEDNVAAVASLVLNLKNPQRAISAGVGWRRGGRALLRRSGAKAARAAGARQRILGPSRLSAFYRKSVLVKLTGFEAWAGDALADVELALRIRQLKMECRFAPESIVYADPREIRTRGFEAARCAERIYKRHAAQFGWTARLLHPFSVLRESLAGFPFPAVLTSPAGRIAAMLEPPERRGLSSANGAEDVVSVESSHRSGLRVDAPHTVAATRNGPQRQTETKPSNRRIAA